MISIALSGDAFVGKTCFFKRFSVGQFEENTSSSIGCDVTCKKLILEGKSYNVQLWDTAGQEIFRSTTATYFRNRSCVLFMFDLTSSETLSHVEDWLKTFYEINNENTPTLLVLIGTKCDLVAERVVTEDQAKEFAKTHSIPYFECSSRLNINIDTIIHFVLKNLRNPPQLQQQTKKEEEPVILHVNVPDSEESQNDGMCC
ncbi:GTP-binding protein YPT1, putative [Entamoeba invadens IP1]|uniref:GTP-binding protein YPT1, putative n=1 Tax=Entamoeba invadens IP1 TaxID=370355 RepID=A0A0A1U4E7_ENTIV|nr:GTP-binding protein YPT1, putative [Entamoeba invadens IP1]ELP87736.1 GTP-binding protein YPT1, putative [Entamoeba invadens IP1]|eukprot:XP_004254507.1 GTP-binding protein YPT1, putative [Entamoeba invadens IP1]